jgi:hypothetical protein
MKHEEPNMSPSTYRLTVSASPRIALREFLALEKTGR